MPKTAIFVPTTTTDGQTDYFTPCAYVDRVIKLGSAIHSMHAVGGYPVVCHVPAVQCSTVGACSRGCPLLA